MYPRAANGVLPVSIFRDVRCCYVFRRLGEATDEFFDALLAKLGEVKPDATREQLREEMVAALRRTVPTWGSGVIKQRVQRVKELARDFESTLHVTFAMYVKDAYAEDLRGRRRKVQVCMPRVADFVHFYFRRIAVAPEVRNGAYWSKGSTAARNFAVSNAMLDALAECCVDNVRIGHQLVEDRDLEEDRPSRSRAHDVDEERYDDERVAGAAGADEAAARIPTPQVREYAPTAMTPSAHSLPPPSDRFHTFVPPATRAGESRPPTQQHQHQSNDDYDSAGDDMDDDGGDATGGKNEVPNSAATTQSHNALALIRKLQGMPDSPISQAPTRRQKKTKRRARD
jgi:hypothetical protein